MDNMEEYLVKILEVTEAIKKGNVEISKSLKNLSEAINKQQKAENDIAVIMREATIRGLDG